MSDIFDTIELEPRKRDIFDEIGADGVTAPTPPPVTPEPLSQIVSESTERQPLTAESLSSMTMDEILQREGGLRDEIGKLLEQKELLLPKEQRQRQAEQEFRQAKLTEKPAFLDELGTSLARESASVGASLLEKVEEISAPGSIFEQGTFENLAEPLRAFSESAAVETAEVPKDAPFRTKAKVFVANAVGSTIPFMGASLAATLATGTPLAAFGTSFAVEGQNAKRDALAAGASEQQAEIEGFVVGTINGALEKLQVDEILRFSGVSKGTIKAIVDAAKERSLKNIVRKGGRLTLEVLKNSITEGLQEALQETTSVFAPAITGRDVPKEGKVQRIGLAGLGGAIVGPIFGGAVDTQQVLGEALGEQANEIAAIGQQLNDTEPDEQGFRSIELESTEQARDTAEAFASIAEDQGIDVEIKTDANKLSIKELSTVEGEELASLKRKEEDARQRDKERRQELGVRPGQKLVEQQAVEAKASVEAREGQVLEEDRPRTGLAKEGAVPAAPRPEVIRKNVIDAVEFDPEKPTTSARQVDIDRDRENLGLKEINSPKRRGWQKAQKQAVEKNIPQKALAIASEINTTDKPRIISDIETAGMVVKMTELKNTHKVLSGQLDAAKDEAEIRALEAERQRVQDDFDSLSEAVRKSKSETARALVSTKLTLDEDMSLISVLRTAKAKKGAVLTSKERAQLEKTIKALEKRVVDIEKARAEEATIIAKGQLRRGTKRFTTLTKNQRKAASTQLGNDVKSLLEQGCNN